MATDGTLFFLRGAARMLHNISDEQVLESHTHAPSSSIQTNEDSSLKFAPVIVGLVVLAFLSCVYQLFRAWFLRFCCGREASTINARAIPVHKERIFDLNFEQRQAVLEVIFSETSKAVTEKDMMKPKQKRKNSESVGGDSSTDSSTDSSSDDDEQAPHDVETTDDSEGTQDETEENVCAICLSGYKEGDVSIVSKSCTHIFHKDCILEWLDKHDDCPVCRVDMLTTAEINKAATSLVGKTRMCKAVASLRSDPSSLLRTPPRPSPRAPPPTLPAVPSGSHTTPSNTARRPIKFYGDTWRNHI